MIRPTAPPCGGVVAGRLSTIARLDAGDVALLNEAERCARLVPPRQELASGGEPLCRQRAVVDGWACRQRILIDGRRQILGFLLPGDLYGIRHEGEVISATGIVTITAVVTFPVPPSAHGQGLSRAYAMCAGLEEGYLFAQVARLGRMDAYERIGDWLLEIHARTTRPDRADEPFALPLTQDLMADALGLTHVHVNRILQALRRDGLLHLRSGMASLPDRARLADRVGYEPVRVG